MVRNGLVFEIQRYSVNDGPGIRTTIFFKGCPLRCLWCDNPESQEPFPQLFFFESECDRCYRCAQVCPTEATTISSEGLIKIDRERCQACGACVKACPSQARVIVGKRMTVEKVMEIIKKDRSFYQNSGGGVTASGGEPTCQPDFLLQLFRGCQEYGIDTALETCGYVNWEVLEPILEYVDLVLFDIKHIDPTKHKELTGVSNRLILGNVMRIAHKGTPVIIRVPLIPGYNDAVENVKALGQFMAEKGLTRVDLLPYHALGENKYQRLGREYKLVGVKRYTDSRLRVIQEILESYKLGVSLG